MMQPHILIIAGMHRSGTTLTARWMQETGLHIGDHLLVSRHLHANPEGYHYEDLDFLSLHKAILSDNGYNREGYLSDEPLRIREERYLQAEAIIAARSHLAQWGWKEPRTCLLLDWWRTLLPDAYMLVVYRHHTRVADSILRRKLQHPSKIRRMVYSVRYRKRTDFIRQYLGVWNRYNREILTAVESDPERALVVRVDDLVPQSLNLIEHMNTAWGFQLEPVDAAAIFVQDLMKKGSSYVDPANPELANVLAACDATYAALEEWRANTLSKF